MWPESWGIHPLSVYRWELSNAWIVWNPACASPCRRPKDFACPLVCVLENNCLQFCFPFCA